MNYELLRAAAQRVPAASVQGVWQAIQFRPNFATEECFNIGVIFFEDRKKTPHARLIPSLAGFRALYGNDGADNFKFLLSLLSEQLVDQRKALSPSPQITFGEKKFVSGNNPQEIVDHLFASVVTLARAQDTEDDEASHSATFKTEKLREKMARLARKQMGNDWQSIFRHETVFVKDRNGEQHALDLPIWRGEDLISAEVYGTIVSAQFRSEAHRTASLASGYVNFAQAHEIARNSKGRGGIFILRPKSDDPHYDKQQQLAIDNDIDKITWPYLKAKNVKVKVGTSAEELTEAALSLSL